MKKNQKINKNYIIIQEKNIKKYKKKITKKKKVKLQNKVNLVI